MRKAFSLTVLVYVAFLVSIPAGAVMLAVDKGSPMMYIEPTQELSTPTGWTSPSYDLSLDNGRGDPDNGNRSSNWQAGIYSVGYGDADDSTTIDPDGSVVSVYTRATFIVANASAIQAMMFRIIYDDG